MPEPPHGHLLYELRATEVRVAEQIAARAREAEMQAQRKERLRALFAVHPEEWHAGRTTGLALYYGEGPDDSFGRIDTREMAEFVVLCHEYAREQLLGDGG